MISLTFFACSSKIDTAVADADKFIMASNEKLDYYHIESEYDKENNIYKIILSVDLEKYIQTNYPELGDSVQAKRLANSYTAIFDKDTESITSALDIARSEVMPYFEGLDVSIATYHLDATGEYHQYQ